MKPAEKIEKLIKRLHFKASAEMHDRTINDALEAQAKSKKTKSAKLEPSIGRTIMKSKITKLAAAAALIIVVGAAFTAGYAFGTSMMLSSGAVRPKDVEAVKEMVQEYIEAAKKRNLPLMHQLSDQRWRVTLHLFLA